MPKLVQIRLPQTTIPGAVGSICNPRDAKTSAPIPTDGACQCGSHSSHTQQVGDETLRICNNCKTMISSVKTRTLSRKVKP